jgi:hypothetical protein
MTENILFKVNFRGERVWIDFRHEQRASSINTCSLDRSKVLVNLISMSLLTPRIVSTLGIIGPSPC